MENILINCVDNNKFITEDIISKLNEYLDGETEYTISQKNNVLVSIYNYNNRLYKQMKSDNKKIQNLIKNRQNVSSKIELDQEIYTPVKTSKKEEVLEDQSLKIDISFYLELLKDINTYEELIKVLPDKQTDNYQDIINAILVYYYGELMTIQMMLKEDNDEELLNDKKIYQNKINLIKKYREELNNPQIKFEREDNVLVFLTTQSGNVCVKNDIEKDIDSNQYDDVKDLLESLKKGIFKKVKPLNNNNTINGMYQVRKGSIRVTFKRLSSNIYIVFATFYKDFQTSHQYKNYLETRYSTYLSSSDIINEQIKDKEFLNKNEEIYSEIKNILSTTKKGDKSAKVKKYGE